MRRKRTARRAWLGLFLFTALFPAPREGRAEYPSLDDSNVSSRTVSVTQSAGATGAEIGVYHGQPYDGGTLPFPEEAGCQLCPCAYIWADALVLFRESGSGDRPLVFDLNTNEEMLDTDDPDLDVNGGLRIGYSSRLCECWSAELVYLGVFAQSDAGAELEDSLMLPDDFGFFVNNFFGADTVDAEYDSDLHSLESNLLLCCWCGDCCGGGRSLELLAGFRYVNLNEDFSLSAFDSAESTTVYAVDTENNLYGSQFGGRYRRSSGPWSLETTAKAGVFANDMEQSQSPIIDFPDFLFRGSRGSDDTDIAFVGDLNFTVIYQIGELWGLRLGYNLIWLDGVALAPDQLDFTDTPDSGLALDGDGAIFLHGVNFGVETRW